MPRAQQVVVEVAEVGREAQAPFDAAEGGLRRRDDRVEEATRGGEFDAQFRPGGGSEAGGGGIRQHNGYRRCTPERVDHEAAAGAVSDGQAELVGSVEWERDSVGSEIAEAERGRRVAGDAGDDGFDSEHAPRSLRAGQVERDGGAVAGLGRQYPAARDAGGRTITVGDPGGEVESPEVPATQRWHCDRDAELPRSDRCLRGRRPRAVCARNQWVLLLRHASLGTEHADGGCDWHKVRCGDEAVAPVNRRVHGQPCPHVRADSDEPSFQLTRGGRSVVAGRQRCRRDRGHDQQDARRVYGRAACYLPRREYRDNAARPRRALLEQCEQRRHESEGEERESEQSECRGEGAEGVRTRLLPCVEQELPVGDPGSDDRENCCPEGNSTAFAGCGGSACREHRGKGPAEGHKQGS